MARFSICSRQAALFVSPYRMAAQSGELFLEAIFH